MKTIDNYYLPRSEADQIEELLSTLNSKVRMDNSLTDLCREDFSKIYKQFKALDTSIYNHKEFAIDSNGRMDDLIDIMSSIADLDFSREAEVQDEYNHLDYIVLRINLMKDRLFERFQRRDHIKNVFDAFEDLYIITNEKGFILQTNKAIKKYGLQEENLVGSHIKKFFEHENIQKVYGIDYDRVRSIHGLERGYRNSPNSNTVLQIFMQSYTSPNHVNGFFYRITPQNIALYNNCYEEEIINKLKELKKTIADEFFKTNQKTELLRQIKEIFEDSSDLNFMEMSILNSINCLTTINSN